MRLAFRCQPSDGSNMEKRSRRQRLSTVSASTFMAKFLGGTLLLLLASPVQAQVGTTICSCSPPTYEFTLDFSLTCDDTRLPSPGIADFECVIAPFQTGADIDLTPASVETTDFVEFDQALGRLAESSIFDQLRDGDTITYTATTTDPGAVTMPSVPKALKITMLAQNSVGQPLLMTWMITFTNNCNQFPVLSVGDTIGWTRFSAVTEPDSSICRAAEMTPPPTKAPVMAPSPSTRHPTYAPIGPCRPYGSTRKSMMNKKDKKMSAKGKGRGPNIFYDPYYYPYYKGKGMSTSKSKKKGGKMSHSSKHHHTPYQYYYYDGYGESSMKSGKSRHLKMSKSSKHLYHYAYPGPGDYYLYSKGKGEGKGYYLYDRMEDEDEEDDDGYNDLPICPPPRPRPPTGPTPRSYRPPATSPTADDDDQVHLKMPRPTMAPTPRPANPTTPGSPPNQQQIQSSGEKPASGQSNEGPASPPSGVVSSWGDDEGGGRERVRAVLFAGAGVAAGLIAIVAMYIYRREKQYVAKEISLHQQSRSQPRRLGALPREPRVPMVHTMSATVATESDVAALKA